MSLKQPLFAIGLVLSAATFNARASLTSYTGAGGVGLVYSSLSDVTWTKDGNLLGTMMNSQGYNNVVNAIIATSPTIYDIPNAYDTPSNSGQYTVSASDFSSSFLGQTTWFGALAFTSYLNSINYGGSNQWALPSAGSNPQYGYNQTNTTFGELYNELGGAAGQSILNLATFDNEQAYPYWLGTEYAPYPDHAWYFDIVTNGLQGVNFKSSQFYAWSISPGQVAAVPVPGAAWLFGSALLSLLGLKRRGHTG